MIIDELIKIGVITKECRKLPIIKENERSQRLKCKKGQPKFSMSKQVIDDYINRNMDVKELASTYNVSIPTIRKALRGEYNV